MDVISYCMVISYKIAVKQKYCQLENIMQLVLHAYCIPSVVLMCFFFVVVTAGLFHWELN